MNPRMRQRPIHRTFSFGCLNMPWKFQMAKSERYCGGGVPLEWPHFLVFSCSMYFEQKYLNPSWQFHARKKTLVVPIIQTQDPNGSLTAILT